MPLDIFATVDDGGVGALLALADKSVQDDAKKELRSASFLIEKIVKEDMPVDTGRARASWGHWSPGSLQGDNKDANEDDAIWEESADGMTITQGTNVEYVKALNEGHSRQIGSGFIDAAAQLGALKFIEGIERLLGKVFG